jgi:hypothetical protein
MIRKTGLYILAGFFAVLCMVLVATVVTLYFGTRGTPPETYVIDARAVVRIFLEERGTNFSDEETSLAIASIDEIVLGEAERIYRETGSVIVNKAHMLAGGRDVTEEFARMIIAAWDARS